MVGFIATLLLNDAKLKKNLQKITAKLYMYTCVFQSPFFNSRYLIDSLQRSYLNTVPGGKQLDVVSKETTPFNQIFGGYMRQEVTCMRCRHVSTTFQHIMDILVDIRQASTLDEALSQTFKAERLGQAGDEASMYKCEKCKIKVPAKRR